MSVGTSCSHFGGNPDRFHQFLSGSSMAKSRLGVTFNAVWALRHVCHCDGDQLFRSGRKGPFSEYFWLNAWKASSVAGDNSRRFCATSRVIDGYITSDIQPSSSGAWPPLRDMRTSSKVLAAGTYGVAAWCGMAPMGTRQNSRFSSHDPIHAPSRELPPEKRSFLSRGSVSDQPSDQSRTGNGTKRCFQKLWLARKQPRNATYARCINGRADHVPRGRDYVRAKSARRFGPEQPRCQSRSRPGSGRAL
jgi:hypothetical protein